MINNIENKGQNKILQMQIFSPQESYSVEYIAFLESDLGRLWQKIPFADLSRDITTQLSKQGKHVPSWGYLDIRGAIAAKVLSCYYNGLSDRKLIEKLNLSKIYRWFCFMSHPMSEQIKDKDLLWRWRQFLGTHIDLDTWNMTTLKAWKQDLAHPQLRLTDATCYEVNIAYPTSVNLLWQSCEWVYKRIPQLIKALGLPSKRRAYRRYEEQKARQMAYAKKRKKTHRQTHNRIGQLLHWLEKGIDIIKPLLKLYEGHMFDNFLKHLGSSNERKMDNLRIDLERFKTIRKVFEQQKQLHEDPKSKIEDRIVSLHQPHIRPIVRGKENKRVEFGPKVNMLRVGGISVVERFSFNSFNETTSFQSACTKYDTVTGKCQQIGADAIYATNRNRRFATQEKMATCFVPKGKQVANEEKKQEQKKARSVIATIRATHMEGSFGNEKQHYDTRKIVAKTPQTQKCALLCAVLTANAMTLVKKDRDKEAELLKRQRQKQHEKGHHKRAA
jgi:transposase, IS5 family